MEVGTGSGESIGVTAPTGSAVGVDDTIPAMGETARATPVAMVVRSRVAAA